MAPQTLRRRDFVSKQLARFRSTTGRFIEIDDIKQSEYYVPEMHDNYRGTGVPVKSILCSPIHGFVPGGDDSPAVIGVLQPTSAP